MNKILNFTCLLIIKVLKKIGLCLIWLTLNIQKSNFVVFHLFNKPVEFMTVIARGCACGSPHMVTKFLLNSEIMKIKKIIFEFLNFFPAVN